MIIKNKPYVLITGISGGIGNALVNSYHEAGYKIIGTDLKAPKNLKLVDFEKTFFYSDSHNDLALLEVVTNPVVVNGDKILLEKAQEKNWPKLNLK